jgi:uncharacterized membrane protein YqiK
MDELWLIILAVVVIVVVAAAIVWALRRRRAGTVLAVDATRRGRRGEGRAS